MTKVEVRVVPIGRGYRLELYHGGVHMGEYERSFAGAQSGDLEAKVAEAEGASDLLLEARERSANGKVAVRWNGATRPRRKEIRTYRENQPGAIRVVAGPSLA